MTPRTSLNTLTRCARAVRNLSDEYVMQELQYAMIKLLEGHRKLVAYTLQLVDSRVEMRAKGYVTTEDMRVTDKVPPLVYIQFLNREITRRARHA